MDRISLPDDWLSRLKHSTDIYVPNVFTYERVTSPSEALLTGPQIFHRDEDSPTYIFVNQMTDPLFFVPVPGKKQVRAPNLKNILLLDNAVMIRFTPQKCAVHFFFEQKLFLKSFLPHIALLDPDVFNFLYEYKPESLKNGRRLAHTLTR